MTKKDDQPTYVRVGNGPFRETSEAVFRLQVEMDRLRADIMTSDAELQATEETEPARRTAFTRMYAISAISLLFLAAAASIPPLTFYLGIAFWSAVFIGALSLLVGAVREQKSHTLITENMLWEEYARGIASVIFAALYFTSLYLLRASWLAWLLSWIYCYVLLMQTSFTRIYTGRSALLLKVRLKKAEAEAELLVSSSLPASDTANASVITEEADHSHGVGPKELTLTRRR